MDSSRKRPRAEDSLERETLSDTKRLQSYDRQSHRSKSNPPHQNQEQYTLPEPPARAGRKPVSSQDNRGGNMFGTFVKKHITPNEYQHKPLSLNPEDDQIRLLILRPGNIGEIIQCRFLVLRLSDPEAKRYEALSYYWGIELADREIKIENLEPNKDTSRSKKWHKAFKAARPQSFSIRPNLHKALTHLRDNQRDIVLWVDALCINQEDEKEKTMQVQKMARIYSRARRVLVWLGPSVSTLESSKKKCEEAVDFIDEILNLASFDAKVKDEESPSKWAALVELMRCDWFSRRWVVQELALASDATLHYNDKEINWKDFADAVAIFATRFDSIKQLFLHSREFDHNVEHLGDVHALGAAILIDVTANHFRRSSEAPDDLERLSSLEALVSRLLKFEASDPRDTVYALLSICKEKHSLEGSSSPTSSSLPVSDSTYPQNKLVPDYEKDIVEVYRDFTEYCVSTSRSIDIICRHWAPSGWNRTATLKEVRISRKKKEKKQNINPKIPSWVPLLTNSPFGAPRHDQHSRVNGDSLVGYPDRKCYNASGGMEPEVRFENVPLGHAVSRSQPPPTPLGHRMENLEGYQGAEAAHTDLPGTDVLRTRSTSSSSASSSSQSAQSVKSEPPRDRDHEETPINAFFMFVTGIQIAPVTKISSRIASGLLTQECLKMGGWNGPNDPNHEIPDELWRTLVAGRGPDGGNPPGWYDRACWECFHLGTSSGDVNMSSLINSSKTPSLIVEFLKRVQGIVWDKLFVRSDEPSLFGLGPRGTQLGDLICVLFGCSVPVILRPQMDSSGSYIMHYEIVGESYIYGMMDGEAISKILPKTSRQEFKLG